MQKRKRIFKLVLIGVTLVGVIALPALLSLRVDYQSQLDTDLITALRSRDEQEVRSLLKQGADPNAREQRDRKSVSLWGHIRAFVMRVHRPEFDPAPSALSCALLPSTETGTAAPGVLVKLLVEYGADVKLCEHSDWPPLILAEEWADSETVRLLLEHGADANVHSNNGMTALRMGIGTSDPQMVQSLLDHGAHVEAQKSIDGQSDFDFVHQMAQLSPERATGYAQILALLTQANQAHRN